MSFQAMTWAVEHKLQTNLKMVLIMLANRTNHDTGRCDPSHKRLAEDCGMSVSTVKRAIEQLEALGLLSTENRKEGSVHLPNQYVLHLDKVGSQRTYPVQKKRGVAHSEPTGGSTQNGGGGVTQSDKTGSSKPGSKPGIEPMPPVEPAGQHAGDSVVVPMMDVVVSGIACSIPANKKYPGPDSEYHVEWAAYAFCYNKRKRDWPECSGVALGIIKNILRVIPRAEFPSVIGAFMKSSEQYIVTRGHDLKDLAANPQKYLTIARTGRQTTSTQARHEDRTAAVRSKADEAYEQALAMQGGRHAEP